MISALYRHGIPIKSPWLLLKPPWKSGIPRCVPPLISPGVEGAVAAAERRATPEERTLGGGGRHPPEMVLTMGGFTGWRLHNVWMMFRCFLGMLIVNVCYWVIVDSSMRTIDTSYCIWYMDDFQVFHHFVGGKDYWILTWLEQMAIKCNGNLMVELVIRWPDYLMAINEGRCIFG